MVLLQLGFLGAVEITASNLYEQLDFDVALLAPAYEQFFAPGLSASGCDRPKHGIGRGGVSALCDLRPLAAVRLIPRPSQKR